MNLKQNKGIGLADALIAVVILMVFTGVIISVSYNIYLQSNFIKRNEQATNYIVEIFEYAQGQLFDELTQDKLKNYINLEKKYENAKAVDGPYTDRAEKEAAYTIFINVEDKYPGYIKELNVTVMYNLGGKTKTVNMKTLINK